MDVARVALMELFRDEITCCAPSRHDGRPFLVGIWYTADGGMIRFTRVEFQTNGTSTKNNNNISLHIRNTVFEMFSKSSECLLEVKRDQPCLQQVNASSLSDMVAEGIREHH